MSIEHDPDDLIRLFNTTFASENTVLVRGGDEPIYLPATDEVRQHQIVFAHGFFASALHEIAHWCIAGAARRRLVDYGYWYCADGRTEAQQAAFEQAEARPQALEWAFSLAARFRFHVSVDNLSGAPVDRAAFQRRVHDELRHYFERGFPPRALRMLEALTDFYGGQLSQLPPEPVSA